jgi:hypothetical protein
VNIKSTCLTLATCLIASCGKNESKTRPAEASSRKTRTENRVDAPVVARETTPAANASSVIDPPISHPVDAMMIRPAGTVSGDTSWDLLTAEQRIEKFKSSGISRVPKDVSDKILAAAAAADSPEQQLLFITGQAAAWHHINNFKESEAGPPQHMKTALLERLAVKHDKSWMDMMPELEEQLAASIKVTEMRVNGIPGMTLDETHDLLMNAIEKYGPDYKTILAIAEQSAGK